MFLFLGVSLSEIILPTFLLLVVHFISYNNKFTRLVLEEEGEPPPEGAEESPLGSPVGRGRAPGAATERGPGKGIYVPQSK